MIPSNIENMRCQICGQPAVGYNCEGAFCSIKEHYISNPKTLKEWNEYFNKNEGITGFTINNNGKISDRF